MFITVGGVVEFDFSRILCITDELCAEGIMNSKMTKAQIGYCQYVPRNYKSYRFTNGKSFHDDIRKADAIITHGGVGTLIYALKAQKKVITFPRLKMYYEHLDDHQIDICKEFEREGYCLMATNKEELAECVKKIENFEPRIYVTDNSKITKILTQYIDNL